LFLGYLCNSKNNAMLIEFKFKNFLSYKDEVSFSLSRIKSFKELENENVFKTRFFDLLKTGVIFGTNGGGKTNFIAAMGFMKNVLHNSFAESLKKEEDRGRKDFYFKLSEVSIIEPTFFEVSFIKNDVLYRYGFEIKGYEIVSEWLTQKIETETELFSRRNNTFKINNTSFAEGNKYKNDVNKNVLFISHLAQNNGKIASIIFDWFENLNAVSGLFNNHYNNVTKELIKNNAKFRNWLAVAVKFLNINNVSTNSDDKIITYHNKFDKNEIIIGAVPFNLETDESEGTIKLIYILGAIYDTLIGGKILFIDELDSKLHPNLTKKLIAFFHQFNNKNAQFIFTAHDSVLLDKDLFRRDQIWFVDKNKFGSSQLYSLSEFNASTVRNTSDFRKKYLELNFGAANSIDLSNQLIELMYD
jgi:AAA15 family ATPase/GTPase